MIDVMLFKVLYIQQEDGVMKKNRYTNSNWEEIIKAFSDEAEPEIQWYVGILTGANITIEMLRKMTANRGFHISKRSPTSLEITFRKGDHSAATVISSDGDVKTMMKDFLHYI